MKRVMIFAAVLAMLGSPISNAATANITAKVNRVLIADQGKFGGCMVALSVSVNATLPNCPGNWVSFSCSGDFTTKDVAFRMLDMAQMAKALNKNVLVTVDDTKKHNGFCYGSRVDIM
jgi:hypothetical protein